MKTSERVEREFKEWQERYDIPYHDEFQVKTLLKLQEEYDDIEPSEKNTRTRESLLGMINYIQSHLNLKEKQKYSLYYDWSRSDDEEKNSVIVYCKDKFYGLKGVSLETAANYICSVAKENNCEIYGDSYGLGRGISDYIEQRGLVVHPLVRVRTK